MESRLATLPLEVACNYIRRLDIGSLVALSKDPTFREQVEFCVQELQTSEELKDTDLVQIPTNGLRVRGVISLQSFQNLALVSSRIRGDLFLILDEQWKGSTTEELASRLMESLKWLFVRKTLYPKNYATLRFRNQQYEFGWFPKTRRLTIYFPSGFEDYDYSNAPYEENAVLPLNQILNPLLIRLTPLAQSYQFIPYSIPDEAYGPSKNLIGMSYGPFLRAMDAEQEKGISQTSSSAPYRDIWDFIRRNLQEFPIDD